MRSLPTIPPEASPTLLRLLRFARRPLDRFLAIEAASGILLLTMAALAIALSNSAFRDSYLGFWQQPLGVKVASFDFVRPLDWWVNDVLMSIFFFVVGLEIRREMHHGELSEWRRASLPVYAAIGGMVVPACIYFAFAGGSTAAHGWGVPMATDIAFAVGVLALLGKRVPPALRVLLLALAVIDDLGAIVVIAIFYSSGIHLLGFGVAALGLLLVFAMARFGVRQKIAYVLPGAIVWGGVYAGGVHPTIAGVLLGLMTPVTAWLGTAGFLREAETELNQLRAARSDHESAESLRTIARYHQEAQSPSESLIESLHPWVAYFIMPVFALANAGVVLSGVDFSGDSIRAIAGVSVGLVVGKFVGVVGACFLAIKLGVSVVPRGIGARHFVVLGLVAGIGFTMALFVAQLAFDSAALLSAAKVGVMCGSVLAGVAALVVGRLTLAPQSVQSNVAQSADEAEASTEM